MSGAKAPLKHPCRLNDIIALCKEPLYCQYQIHPSFYTRDTIEIKFYISLIIFVRSQY